MKLAIIGSYGHVGTVLGALEQLPDVRLAAAARWGPDDPLGFMAGPGMADVAAYDDYAAMLDEVRPDVAAVFLSLIHI